jgi:NAD(P)-dependent dehydrogenase (short-subunit alcohol dehydrogenase family)
MRLSNRVAFITGGASGIGRAMSEVFAREGAKVLLADLVADEGGRTVEAIKAAGGEAQFFQIDVRDATQIKQGIEQALNSWGHIDILCNGAGILYYGTVLDTSEDDWQRVLSVNLTGTYLCSKHVLPYMIRQGRGAIVNLASTVGGHDACAHAAAYVASKGGVTLLTRAMAIDHAHEGIRVNAICPGPTDTPMLRKAMTSDELQAFAKTYPMERLAQPEEIAAAALFLVSDEASFVTGSVMYVDGGQTAEV